MMERILLGVLFLSEWFILSTCLIRHYHFVDQTLTWTEAQTYCRQTYTDLATIQNSEELNQLMNTLSSAGYSSDVWIGLKHEIEWRWSDGFNGTGAEYRNWASGQPSFYSCQQFCGDMSYFDAWGDYDCQSSKPFICYEGSQQNPEYVLVNEAMNWSSAQSYCRGKFIDLATMRNNAESQTVRQKVPAGHRAWIGLYRDPTFYWSDGSSFLFENWEGTYNRLNSLKVICGFTSSSKSGKWKLLPCETKSPFVCYSYPIMKKVVKMRLKVDDSVDLEDPAVKAELLKQLQDRLEEDGVTGVTLKWREQPDGQVFHKEEKRKKSEL